MRLFVLFSHLNMFRHHLACWLEQEIGIIRQLCNLNASNNADELESKFSFVFLFVSQDSNGFSKILTNPFCPI